MNIYTVRTGAIEISKSEIWLRHAIRLKMVQACKVGNQWLIEGDEIRRLKKSPIKITKEDWRRNAVERKG